MHALKILYILIPFFSIFLLHLILLWCTHQAYTIYIVLCNTRRPFGKGSMHMVSEWFYSVCYSLWYFENSHERKLFCKSYMCSCERDNDINTTSHVLLSQTKIVLKLGEATHPSQEGGLVSPSPPVVTKIT